MFIDLQRDPEVSLGEVLAIKRSVGATLYECDARVAAYSSAPLCLSDQDIEDYFEGTGKLAWPLVIRIVTHMSCSNRCCRAGPCDR